MNFVHKASTDKENTIDNELLNPLKFLLLDTQEHGVGMTLKTS
jgi:hypothetical protein